MKPFKEFAVNHLEPRFYGALWYIALAMLIAMAIMGWEDRTRFREEIVFTGALLAIVVATIGWIWSGRMTILMTRKNNALALLERLSSEYVSGLKKVVYGYVSEYNEFQEAECEKKRPEMPEAEIEQLLSVYEQVAVAIVHGAADYEMLKQAQFLVFKRIYLGLRHHIDKVQEIDSAYYEYFERLTCTWHPELQKKTAVFRIDGGLFNPMAGADA